MYWRPHDVVLGVYVRGRCSHRRLLRRTEGCTSAQRRTRVGRFHCGADAVPFHVDGQCFRPLLQGRCCRAKFVLEHFSLQLEVGPSGLLSLQEIVRIARTGAEHLGPESEQVEMS